MRLTRRRLNRTLLRRQHLLERTALSAADVADHLIGLQAQEPVPPYLSLAARVADFDPYAVSRGLDDGSWVRLGSLRGTLHVHTAADALAVRPWLQPALEQQMRGRVPASGEEVAEVTHELLADGPVEHRELGERLAARLPGRPADLTVVARTIVPLVQLPPRGTWHGSGGIVWDHLERRTGGTLVEPDTEAMVRRYLRAFGPATSADLSVWSTVTRLRPVLTRMPDLVRHEDVDGKVLFDVADGPIEDEETPAPVRLLGTYDNSWLSHAARDRVTEAGTRGNWMGANGGVAMTIFVDGWLSGLWRIADGRVRIVDLFRDLTPAERSELDDEIARVESLLRR
ncbi:winged helix DNA-binding domain-containing protein [Nocardioides sp. YIM 152315]|uniref:winged helix DNA-binding domain-containing protein n=1 Tax=Nocardioides sp. YIM 152315 TaxID=3031760 RepID=UPI0023DA7754|nr:winged helix DNA-binding domain-containing protein [Nocardioides sp. YIM 152315]MDF1602055.1 winged helix DNA-binding domain-containing protein [Nocardioides sp. YIM 152315]